MSSRILSAFVLCTVLLAGCSSASATTPIPTLEVTPGAGGTAVPSASTASGVVTASAEVAPVQNVDLGFAAAGIIQEIGVAEGDQVGKGSVLARLSNREQLEAAVAAARLQLVNAQQAVDTLMANADLAKSAAQLALAQAQVAYHKASDHREGMKYPRASQIVIDNAWSAYQLALTHVATAQDGYDKVRVLPDNHPLKAGALFNLTNAQKERDTAFTNYSWMTGKPTQEDINTADAELAVAKAKLDDAQRQFDKFSNGPDPDQLGLAYSQLANAQAQLTAAQAALNNIELTAPFDGAIISVDATMGQVVNPGQAVLTLADISALQVETTDLSERDLSRIRIGQPAVVTITGLEKEIPGEVIKIAPRATKSGGDVVYKVTIRLNEQPAGLRWGMSATVEIRP